LLTTEDERLTTNCRVPHSSPVLAWVGLFSVPDPSRSGFETLRTQSSHRDRFVPTFARPAFGLAFDLPWRLSATAARMRSFKAASLIFSPS
jgi:hypothetical protein